MTSWTKAIYTDKIYTTKLEGWRCKNLNVIASMTYDQAINSCNQKDDCVAVASKTSCVSGVFGACIPNTAENHKIQRDQGINCIYLKLGFSVSGAKYEQYSTIGDDMTCADKFEISGKTAPSSSHISWCRNECDADLKCSYFHYVSDGLSANPKKCYLYSDCSETKAIDSSVGFGPTFKKQDPCDSKPCLNGGQCTQILGGKFTCKCIDPYTGNTCEEVLPKEEELISPMAAQVAAAVAGSILLAAAAPPPLAMFPPQGLPQPSAGGVGGGGAGGVLPASVGPVLAAEISSLVSGINGAVVLAAFSSSLPGSFAVPRTVPATAVLIAEPGITAASRQSAHPTSHQQESCPRPIINLGRKLKFAENKISPFLDLITNITSPISNIQSKMSEISSRIIQKLRLECLIPRLLHPFEPIFKYTRCTLGLNDDGFMATPPCNASACVNPIIEDRTITRDRGLPNLDFMIDGKVSTMDECFGDMEKVVYGTRIQAKIVDDQPCEDPKYEKICQDLIEQNRMLLEENCETPGCVLPSDDPFKACFGCESEITVKVKRAKRNGYTYPDFYSYIDRQTGEAFQATSQSRRVVCGVGPGGRRRCRLRIDRAMQLRMVSYGKALQFIQSEQYLGDDDVPTVLAILKAVFSR